jgi:hypothetical protein
VCQRCVCPEDYKVVLDWFSWVKKCHSI